MASSSARAFRTALGPAVARRSPPQLARPSVSPLAAPLWTRNKMVNAESTGTVIQVGKQQHWTAFMYGRERQLLVHVVNSVEEGDVDGILQAIDDFWGHHFHMKGADTWSVRKEVLDKTISDKKPERCLELGTYCGYSALRIARNLPENGKLVSMEIDPLFCAIATKIIEYAGLQDKVKVLTGTVETKMQRIQEVLAKPGENVADVKVDFVLCDHSKDRFLPDLELLESSQVVGAGTVVMGDTTPYPGEESADDLDLLSHFVASNKFRIQQHVGTEKTAGITVCEWQHLV